MMREQFTITSSSSSSSSYKEITNKKWNENDFVKFLLTSDNVGDVFEQACVGVRDACECPNGRLCKDKFAIQGNIYLYICT